MLILIFGVKCVYWKEKWNVFVWTRCRISRLRNAGEEKTECKFRIPIEIAGDAEGERRPSDMFASFVRNLWHPRDTSFHPHSGDIHEEIIRIESPNNAVVSRELFGFSWLRGAESESACCHSAVSAVPMADSLPSLSVFYFLRFSDELLLSNYSQTCFKCGNRPPSLCLRIDSPAAPRQYVNEIQMLEIFPSR